MVSLLDMHKVHVMHVMHVMHVNRFAAPESLGDEHIDRGLNLAQPVDRTRMP